MRKPLPPDNDLLIFRMKGIVSLLPSFCRFPHKNVSAVTAVRHKNVAEGSESKEIANANDANKKNCE